VSALNSSELLARRIDALAGDERLILEALVSRIELGASEYGPWHIDDGRDYPKEAFAEVIDGLHYCAAELVRRRRLLSERRRRVYVCHPFAGNPERNIAAVRLIARKLVAQGYLPIAPHLYLPQFIDEATERSRALDLCLGLVECSDELRVFGSNITAGMRIEIHHARERGIPVIYVEEEPS
jgi:hypothetical protein